MMRQAEAEHQSSGQGTKDNDAGATATSHRAVAYGSQQVPEMPAVEPELGASDAGGEQRLQHRQG